MRSNMRRFIVLLYPFLLLIGCSKCSSNSEVQQKYQACKMIMQLSSQQGGEFSAVFQPKVDCDLGLNACNRDINGSVCKDFLASVTYKD